MRDNFAIFEWEMLFPDRMDFLILSPLPLKPKQMLAAKAIVLTEFLGLFLIGSNFFAALILPLGSLGGVFRNMAAQTVAVGMAGTFAALFFLALGGILLCVLNAAHFRLVSPILQTLSVMLLALLLWHMARYGGSMEMLHTASLGWAYWMPPFWFLGLYERLLHGGAAEPFAREMSRWALGGIATSAAVVLLTYPLAWAKMRKMAVEGATPKRSEDWHWLAATMHALVRKPGERAVFHFIGQTLRRSTRYQAYMAMYCGVGLALAVAFGVTIGEDCGRAVVRLSTHGLHSVMPLLVFWIVAGLRTAFALPVNLRAGWVFRMTGVALSDCAQAARKWALLCAVAVVVCIGAAFCVAGWGWRDVVVQAICGLGLSVLLTDAFFFSQLEVPFHRPRLPGRTSLPLMLTLYLGAFPPLLEAMVAMELWMERDLPRLLWVGIAVGLCRLTRNTLRRRFGDAEEEVEGYEGEIQLLRLS